MIKHPLQIDSILYSSWGYDQTNINFYQVIQLVGNSTVVLRELAQEIDTSPNSFIGKTKPILNQFIGEAFRKRLRENGIVRIESFINAYPWNGSSRNYSSYS
ncbi:hypothetical protein J2N86_15970 (plasmid) [Legionella lytica]|uniref:Uncharacterized protein n=1 Tax=Legionella lytica TaxID=96232 RepID=A0ABY4YD45_9GAMM|nr:hypothetical protein [Legionella lytica]USQ15521.1 hypothetical protein J2N86_15970 [Legionella lytica]